MRKPLLSTLLAPWNRRVLIATVLATGAVSCSEKAVVEEVERPRPVKVYVLGAEDKAASASFPGQIVPAQRAELSFSVAGTVAAVFVEDGVRVAAGDAIAELDRTPFLLARDEAAAEKRKMVSRTKALVADLLRSERLFERDLIAPVELERQRTALDTARAELAAAEARLAQAETRLASSALTAPFDGVVVMRSAEAFQNVAPGQAVLELDRSGAVHSRFSVPQAQAGKLELGDEVQIAAVSGETTALGTLVQIAGTATGGDSVVVEARVDTPGPTFRPGVSVSNRVHFRMRDVRQGETFFVPVTALRPGSGEKRGAIFKLDDRDMLLQEVEVGIVAITGDGFIVDGPLARGDMIVSAGVPFLYDGQPARRYRSERS